MSVNTTAGTPVECDLIRNYFKSLVNKFFKILPMRENGEPSLCVYMQSLQVELLGCQCFIEKMRTDASYLTLLSILQYLIDNPECTVREVRREVFNCISICNKLKSKYIEEVLLQ